MEMYLLSIDKIKCLEALDHLKKHGFNEITVISGKVVPIHLKNIESVNKAIFEGHYQCALHFASLVNAKKHMIVFEDDCQFVEQYGQHHLKKEIDYLDRCQPEWGSLHVGHIPLGLIFPVVGHWSICHTLNPYTGHCYVLNGQVVQNLITNISPESWARPNMVEGMKMIPFMARFAIFPSVAMQKVIPREMKNIIGCVVSFKVGCRATEIIAMIISVVSLVLVLVLLRQVFQK